MTRTIAGRSSSKRVSGSLVNHFGGSPSEARPAHAVPSTDPRTTTNTCGNSVMDAIPYRNGNLVRIHLVRNETESTFSDILVSGWVAASYPDAPDTTMEGLSITEQDRGAGDMWHYGRHVTPDR